jgi:16S rRNA processing protein RimM
MSINFLEAGVVANTHGLHGEIKIHPWADSPDFLTGFDRIFIDGNPVGIISARVHKNCVIASLEGVTDFDSALKLKNKTVCVSRDDVSLKDGKHFIVDLIGLTALDAETGENLGKLADVLNLPSNDVYVIRGQREILVPAVPEFIREVNISQSYVKINMIEGL